MTSALRPVYRFLLAFLVIALLLTGIEKREEERAKALAAQVKEADVKAWLIGWDRSLKTKANYHGLIHGVFAYAVKQGHLAGNPAIGTAPRMSRVKLPSRARGMNAPRLRPRCVTTPRRAPG